MWRRKAHLSASHSVARGTLLFLRDSKHYLSSLYRRLAGQENEIPCYISIFFESGMESQNQKQIFSRKSRNLYIK
jgi:hypothetical protein